MQGDGGATQESQLQLPCSEPEPNDLSGLSRLLLALTGVLLSVFLYEDNALPKLSNAEALLTLC